MGTPEQAVESVVSVERRPDWEFRLARALAAYRTEPFSWGRHDCCMAAANVVLEMTGSDLAWRFRGKYDSAMGAFRTISHFGGLNLLAHGIAWERGLAECDVRSARRGDVVLWEPDAGTTLGVVGMDGLRAWFPGVAGPVLVPVLDCAVAWRIP